MVYFLLIVAIVILLFWISQLKRTLLDAQATHSKEIKRQLSEQTEAIKQLEKLLVNGQTAAAFTDTPSSTSAAAAPVEKVLEPEAEKFDFPAPTTEESTPVESDSTVLLEPIITYDAIEIVAEANEPESSVAAFDNKIPQPATLQNVFEANNDKPKQATAPKKKTFFEQNPDLEKFVGENLINKIGIAILVIGIGFFVKYAIDKEWIHEIGRVFIGILCGGLLLGIAHKLQKNFKAFSAVLVGGGISVLYFTIAIAYQEYKIIDQQWLAFLLMVVITGFAVALALLYNIEMLAILAVVGGFASPIMVSNGGGNYIVLFSYVLILNTGILILAIKKDWIWLRLTSYVLTIITFAGWYFTKANELEVTPHLGIVLFSMAFYSLFFVMNIAHNVLHQKAFKPLETGLIISNTFIFFGFGLVEMYEIADGKYAGLFTALFAVFNFLPAYYFYSRQKIDKKLVFLLIGLVLTFLALMIPIQLEGNRITLFWAAEALLMLWFSQKTGVKLAKAGSFILSLLLIISLLMDWNNHYFRYDEVHAIWFANSYFATSAVAFIALFGIWRLMQNETAESYFTSFAATIKNMYAILWSIALYLSFYLELSYQLQYTFDNAQLTQVLLTLYHVTFIIIGYFIAAKRLTPALKYIFIGTTLVTFFLVTLGMFNGVNHVVVQSFLFENSGLAPYFLQWLVVAGFVWMLLKTYNLLKELFAENPLALRICRWQLIVMLVLLGSIELDQIFKLTMIRQHFETLGDAWPALDHATKLSHLVGYPLLWGAFSFILMVIGLRSKTRDFRIISLTLFGLILLKLFLLDFKSIPEVGRIISFISLGVIFLTVSFMYQRVKMLLVEEERNEAASEQQQ